MPCGSSTRIDGLVSQLKKIGLEPEVITPIFYEYDIGLASRETNVIRTLNLRWLGSLEMIPKLMAKLLGSIVFSMFSFAVISMRFFIKGRRNGLIVQYEDVFSAPAAILARILFRVTVIGDDVHLHFKNRKPPFSWFQRAYEILILKHTDFVVTSFKLDFHLIRSMRKDRNVLFVPNGIRIGPAPAEVARDPNCLIFVGQFANVDNIEALDDVLYIADRLVEQLRNGRIYVVGGPLETVNELARRKKSNTENISFLGRVSQEQLDLLYRKAAIGILPYFGPLQHTSQRIKALEYLSNCLLVVASPRAVSGFEGLEDGVHYILAKTREDMILQLREVSLNYTHFAQIPIAGRDFVIQNYTWEKVAEPYLNLIESLGNSMNLRTRSSKRVI